MPGGRAFSACVERLVACPRSREAAQAVEQRTAEEEPREAEARAAPWASFAWDAAGSYCRAWTRGINLIFNKGRGLSCWQLLFQLP